MKKLIPVAPGAKVNANWTQLLSVPQQSPARVCGWLTHVESGLDDKSTTNVVVPPTQFRVSIEVEYCAKLVNIKPNKTRIVSVIFVSILEKRFDALIVKMSIIVSLCFLVIGPNLDV